MSLFNIFKKKSKYELDVEYAYHKAIEYAKSFYKNLDFTKESIKDVEEILEYYANDLLQQKDTDEPVTENQIWSMSLWWGVYIGETLRRNYLKSYKWVNDDSVQGFLPILKKDDDWILYPVSKVYKRLTNGKEDSVISFYDVVLGTMTN